MVAAVGGALADESDEEGEGPAAEGDGAAAAAAVAAGAVAAVGAELETAMRRVVTIVTSARRAKFEKKQATVLSHAAETSRQEVEAFERRERAAAKRAGAAAAGKLRDARASLEDVSRRISRANQQHKQALRALWDEYRREHAAAAAVRREAEQEARARAAVARCEAAEVAERVRQRAADAEARVEALRREVERASGSMGAAMARTLGQAE
jgi:hypothetical protein